LICKGCGTVWDRKDITERDIHYAKVDRNKKVLAFSSEERKEGKKKKKKAAPRESGREHR